MLLISENQNTQLLKQAILMIICMSNHIFYIVINDFSSVFRSILQKGVCYYNILIRHDDEITEWMAHGKYGVVRNNWYTLTINSVKQPGTPWIPDKTDPTKPTNPGEDDDDKEAYLSHNLWVYLFFLISYMVWKSAFVLFSE